MVCQRKFVCCSRKRNKLVERILTGCGRHRDCIESTQQDFAPRSFERTAVVQPGVVNQHVSNFAAPHGLYYARIHQADICTIGGNVTLLIQEGLTV